MSSSSGRAVSVIGLGAMGSALARAFLTAGHRVTVWNRTAAKADPLRAAGARTAPSLVEAIGASDVIVICVLDYPTSAGLLGPREVGAALTGKTIVQLTTGTPADAREAERLAREIGAAYLDGAIMGYPRDIGRPECVILHSGAETIFNAVADLLGALGNNLYVGESVGAAATLDLALLSTYYAAMTGYLHGAALCAAEGVSLEGYLGGLDGILPIVGVSAKDYATRIADRRYAGDQATIDIHAAALRHIVRASRDAGIAPVAEATSAWFEKARAAGHGGAEMAALFEVLKR
jgi:3-hydroxyisobutyrate dehydrogenase-like beta-hydroxyacid dehydrogenase